MDCLSTCRECLLSDGGSVRSTAGLWATPLYAVVGDLEQKYRHRFAVAGVQWPGSVWVTLFFSFSYFLFPLVSFFIVIIIQLIEIWNALPNPNVSLNTEFMFCSTFETKTEKEAKKAKLVYNCTAHKLQASSPLKEKYYADFQIFVVKLLMLSQ